jgi:hypothetical protein
VLVAVVVVGAQEQKEDPRVGLKPGFTDAGVAAMNMELVANVPRPANSDLAFRGQPPVHRQLQPGSTPTTSRTRATRS